MQTVNVFWTGGLDSTYRILELSRMPLTIQPYYIWDQTRGSIKQELKAMDDIAKIVKKNSLTKAKLLPLQIINNGDIADDAEITAAWRTLNQKYLLGSQYNYLARFARQHGIKLEVSLESSERSKAATTIKSETQIKINNINILGGKYSFYEIIPQLSTTEGKLIFQDLLLPATIWHMSKLDEVAGYKAMGYGYVINKTWFCHRPIFGLPCGHCNPCKDCLNEGLAFRVPRLGYCLGTIRKLCYGVVRRMKKVIELVISHR